LVDTGQLFLRSLDDLRSRVEAQPADEYDLLGAASILRKLLVDGGGSVALQLRQSHAPDLKLTFRIARAIPPWEILGLDPFLFWSVGDALDPRTTPPGNATVELSLDRFLAEPIARFNGATGTVHGVITQVANVAGGTHLGTAKKQSAIALTKAASVVSVAGLEPAVQCVPAIGRVVLCGLQPLAVRLA
jgi:hypothetical protein